MQPCAASAPTVQPPHPAFALAAPHHAPPTCDKDVVEEAAVLGVHYRQRELGGGGVGKGGPFEVLGHAKGEGGVAHNVGKEESVVGGRQLRLFHRIAEPRRQRAAEGGDHQPPAAARPTSVELHQGLACCARATLAVAGRQGASTGLPCSQLVGLIQLARQVRQVQLQHGVVERVPVEGCKAGAHRG